MMMEISPAQLRAARALLDISQSDLATQLGVSDQTIRAAEKGRESAMRLISDKVSSYFDTQGVVFFQPTETFASGVAIKTGLVTPDEFVSLYQMPEFGLFASMNESGDLNGKEYSGIENAIYNISRHFYQKYNREIVLGVSVYKLKHDEDLAVRVDAQEYDYIDANFIKPKP